MAEFLRGLIMGHGVLTKPSLCFAALAIAILGCTSTQLAKRECTTESQQVILTALRRDSTRISLWRLDSAVTNCLTRHGLNTADIAQAAPAIQADAHVYRDSVARVFLPQPPAPTRTPAARESVIVAATKAYRLSGGKACSRASTARIHQLLRDHAGWPDEQLTVVACGGVLVGMTADQVLAAWGKPTDVNRTTTAVGSSEQWVYGDLDASYVYLDNGVVTTIQN